MTSLSIICGAGTIAGKETMVMELGAGLHEQGYAVDIATSSWGSSDFRRRCVELGLRVHVMRLGFISATLRWHQLRMTAHQMLHWPGLLASYRRFLKQNRPRKVIHTNWHHLLLLAPFLKPDRDIFWIHEVIPQKPQYRKFFRWLESQLRCFVAVSHAVAASLRASGISEQNIHVIHNGISDPATDFVQKAGCDKLIVGIVGQIGAWKGHEDLLEAFAIVAPEFPTAELHVFGKGAAGYERRLREQAQALRIAKRIVWHGFVADRAEIYQAMDVCVVPSRFQEPFGMTAVEAGFFSVPVIATKRGGLPEIVEHSRTGFLVEAWQPEEFASSLKTLLDNPTLRHELGGNARRKVLEQFGRKRFVEDFLRVMEGR